MKTCGQCKRWVRWDHLKPTSYGDCTVKLPVWAAGYADPTCSDTDDQAEDCDCFAPKEDPKCTP